MKLRVVASTFVSLLMVLAMGSTAASAVTASPTPTTVVTASQVKAKELSLSDLPSGWSVEKADSSSFSRTGCLKVLDTPAQNVVRATAYYIHGAAPFLGEILEKGAGASARYGQVKKVFSGCKELSGTTNGVTVKGAVKALTFPRVGTQSSAFATSLKITGVTVDADFVFFEVGQYAGEIVYEALGKPDVGQLRGFVTTAVSKLKGKAHKTTKTTKTTKAHK
jgi:hypothetical protein